eukprot:scaffold109228_cov27-Tisochrysis_lutea.AAC.1
MGGGGERGAFEGEEGGGGGQSLSRMILPGTHRHSERPAEKRRRARARREGIGGLRAAYPRAPAPNSRARARREGGGGGRGRESGRAERAAPLSARPRRREGYG